MSRNNGKKQIDSRRLNHCGKSNHNGYSKFGIYQESNEKKKQVIGGEEAKRLHAEFQARLKAQEKK